MSELQTIKGHTIEAGANLKEANLSKAYLQYARLNGADLQRADLRGTQLYNTNLRGANLMEANLRGANLECGKLQGAQLQECDMTGAHLTDAQLQGADLRYSVLVGVDFSKADLRGADLTGADLTNAIFAQDGLSTVALGLGEKISKAPKQFLCSIAALDKNGDLHHNAAMIEADSWDKAMEFGMRLAKSKHPPTEGYCGHSFVGCELEGDAGKIEIEFEGELLTGYPLDPDSGGDSSPQETSTAHNWQNWEDARHRCNWDRFQGGRNCEICKDCRLTKSLVTPPKFYTVGDNGALNPVDDQAVTDICPKSDFKHKWTIKSDGNSFCEVCKVEVDSMTGETFFELGNDIKIASDWVSHHCSSKPYWLYMRRKKELEYFGESGGDSRPNSPLSKLW